MNGGGVSSNVYLPSKMWKISVQQLNGLKMLVNVYNAEAASRRFEEVNTIYCSSITRFKTNQKSSKVMEERIIWEPLC